VSEPALARDVFQRLRQATANQPDVLAELCRDYVSEARNTLGEMRSALVQADTRQLRERAHYLKGSSMMIGARDLSGCCARLEQMGRDAQLAGADSELVRATAALKTVEAELLRELGPAALPDAGSAA
jgi:HPt (histidine-containing phosphotransfer) domain-containing protein